MQPRSGGDVSNHNHFKPDSSSASPSTSFNPTQPERFYPTNCGPTSLFTHQHYTNEAIPEGGTFGISVSTADLRCGPDLGPAQGISFGGNMVQYSTTTLLPEQLVGGTQQCFQTLIYNRHRPVNPPPPPYQGHEYLLGPYVIDSATTSPSQLATGSPSVFYRQLDQSQGIPITAEVSARQCPTSPQTPGSPPSPASSMNQALGLTLNPYRQVDNGPRRILAVPIGSLSITDSTICGIVASFQLASWMLRQVEEPAYGGKSSYFQLIDESMMACRLCGKKERRAERLVSHLRGHFDHRPYACEGHCGNMDW
jgi:hypothetical protein